MQTHKTIFWSTGTDSCCEIIDSATSVFIFSLRQPLKNPVPHIFASGFTLISGIFRACFGCMQKRGNRNKPPLLLWTGDPQSRPSQPTFRSHPPHLQANNLLQHVQHVYCYICYANAFIVLKISPKMQTTKFNMSCQNVFMPMHFWGSKFTPKIMQS